MDNSNEIRTGRHCVFALHAHLVFLAKYRGEVFASQHLTRLEEITRDVCRDFSSELIEFHGGPDHVHLLVRCPPTVTVSKLVNSLKGVSSRRLRREFPDLTHRYWQGKRLWAGSYFAGTATDAPLPILREYMEEHG